MELVGDNARRRCAIVTALGIELAACEAVAHEAIGVLHDIAGHLVAQIETPPSTVVHDVALENEEGVWIGQARPAAVPMPFEPPFV